MIDVTKVKELISKSKEYAKKSKQYKTRSESTLKKAQESCTHPVQETNSVYWRGSYYDKATTTHYRKCAICGADLGYNVETHSWYG